MFLLIDNYDSFTYNLYHFLGELGADIQVWRNDAASVAELMALKPEGIILSPGPCTPTEAGVCVPLVHACLEAKLPLLGVCLGHQSIGQALGGQVVRAPNLMHGKTSAIHHTGQGLFAALPSPLEVTRYHSLIVEKASLPACLTVTAHSDDGVIQGMQHTTAPIHGLQFHPESIASERGKDMLRNFLTLARQHNEPNNDSSQRQAA